ncbi:unnamed protein product, partial [Prorocentrum cordatum]
HALRAWSHQRWPHHGRLQRRQRRAAGVRVGRGVDDPRRHVLGQGLRWPRGVRGSVQPGVQLARLALRDHRSRLSVARADPAADGAADVGAGARPSCWRTFDGHIYNGQLYFLCSAAGTSSCNWRWHRQGWCGLTWGYQGLALVATGRPGAPCAAPSVAIRPKMDRKRLRGKQPGGDGGPALAPRALPASLAAPPLAPPALSEWFAAVLRRAPPECHPQSPQCVLGELAAGGAVDGIDFSGSGVQELKDVWPCLRDIRDEFVAALSIWSARPAAGAPSAQAGARVPRAAPRPPPGGAPGAGNQARPGDKAPDSGLAAEVGDAALAALGFLAAARLRREVVAPGELADAVQALGRITPHVWEALGDPATADAFVVARQFCFRFASELVPLQADGPRSKVGYQVSAFAAEAVSLAPAGFRGGGASVPPVVPQEGSWQDIASSAGHGGLGPRSLSAASPMGSLDLPYEPSSPSPMSSLGGADVPLDATGRAGGRTQAIEDAPVDVLNFSEVSAPETVRDICHEKVPGWSLLPRESIRIDQLCEGLSNQNFKVQVPIATGDGHIPQVLFRVFGKDAGSQDSVSIMQLCIACSTSLFLGAVC